MNLVIFDIDGTVIAKAAVENACFVKAVQSELGDVAIDPDWSAYEDVTDSGLAIELFVRHVGRHPTGAELERIRARYTDRLRDELRARPGEALQIAGAKSLLRALKMRTGWCMAVATGNWQPIAQFKWIRAGLPYADLPMATADDAERRAEVIEVAVERARRCYAHERFDRVVSVGDALWDLKAARSLGIPFVGVGEDWRNDSRAALVEAVRDFVDVSGTVDLFERAMAG